MDDRRKLGALRVQELKAICQEEGLPITGRKQDFIERLIEHRRVLQAVSERDATPSTDVPQLPEPRQQTSTPKQVSSPSRKSSEQRVAQGQVCTQSKSKGGAKASAKSKASPKRGRPPKAKGGAAPFHTNSRAELSQCCSCVEASCGRGQDSRSVSSSSCTLCRIRTLDPLQNIIQPGILLHTSVKNKVQEFSVDLPEIRQWRRSGFAIEVRMVKVDCNKLHNVWPRKFEFIVNGKEAFSIQPPEEGHKRRDVPQIVTTAFKPGPNIVCTRIEDDNLTRFAWAAILTSTMGMEELSSQISTCSFEESRARVLKFLAGQQSKADGSEDVMCLSSNTFSLLCPISMERINQPVRGKKCKHLQCFDLESYLLSNRQMGAFNNRWVCPVCSLVVRPADCCLDEYVSRVLAASGHDVEDITVASDGSWRSTTASTGQSKILTEVLPEALDLDVEPPIQPSVVAAPPNLQTNNIETASGSGHKTMAFSTRRSPLEINGERMHTALDDEDASLLEVSLACAQLNRFTSVAKSVDEVPAPHVMNPRKRTIRLVPSSLESPSPAGKRRFDRVALAESPSVIPSPMSSGPFASTAIDLT